MRVTKSIAGSVFFLAVSTSFGQSIEKDSPRELPKDLATETILILKFDSLDIPDKKPANVYEKRKIIGYKNFNKQVPALNRELYAVVKKYPFKYKIGHMSGAGSNYKLQGAKYLLWMNSFDAIIWGEYYGGGASDASYRGTMLGIVDLTTDKSYLLSRTIGVGQTIKYSTMIGILSSEVKKQFKLSSLK